MKKYLLLFFALLLALPAHAITFPPSVEILTSPSQISEYKILGQVGETGQAGSYLYGVRKTGGLIGAYNPVTGYQSRTTQFISATATTIPVVSTNDKAGNPIDLSNISSSGTVKVYMNLAPGTSLEEPIVCTGKTTTSWTNCTRGLSFQGTSESASTTLQKPHNAGTPIIITNIAQFYNQFVATDGAQTINGNKTFSETTTFSVIPTVTTGTPTLPGDLVPLNFLTTVTTTGCANASATVRGCVEEATSAEVTAGTGTGGTGARLYVPAQQWLEHADENITNNVDNGETVVTGNILYVSSTGKHMIAHANVQGEVDKIDSVAFEGGTSGSFIKALYPGSIMFDSGLTMTTGSLVFLSDSGRASTTAGTIRKIIGLAYGNNTWVFKPDATTPTSTRGTAFTPLMLNSSGTLTTTIFTTTTNASQVLRNIAAGATWDTLKSYSGNFTFTGGGAITTTIGFEPKTINFSCGGQSGSGTWNTSITDGYWVSTGTQFTVGTTATSASNAQNEYTNAIVGAVRGGGGASYNQLTVAVSATSTSGFTVTATQSNGPTTINCIYTAREF